MKRPFAFLSVIIVLVFALGCCQDQQTVTELEKFAAKAEVEQKNIELVQWFIQEVNNQNPEIYMEACAPDYKWYFPSSNPESLSREEELEFVKGVWTAFPDMNWVIDDVIAADDRVVTLLTAKGTHEGDFLGIAPTGNPIDVSLILVFRIEDGKIVESREEADMLKMMEQIGMVLRPSGGED